MNADPIRRIFIVGSARSGTTLLQCLMAAHCQIASLPETDFFVNLVSGQRRARMLGLAPAKQDDQYDKFLSLIPPELRVIRRSPFAAHRARYFVRTMDAIARGQQKTAWVEKSPYHTSRIDSIERYVPGARFIHNVRNGADNIASHYDVIHKYQDQWTYKDTSLDHCIDWWLQDVRQTLRHAHKPNHLVVGYRQVSQDTCATMQRVCEFIGLPFDEEMLKGYAGMVKTVATPKEAWKSGVAEPIASRDGTKFMQLFTEEQRQHILTRVAEVDMSPLGII